MGAVWRRDKIFLSNWKRYDLQFQEYIVPADMLSLSIVNETLFFFAVVVILKWLKYLTEPRPLKLHAVPSDFHIERAPWRWAVFIRT